MSHEQHCNSCVMPIFGHYDEGFNKRRAPQAKPPQASDIIKVYPAKKIITMNPLQPEASAIAVQGDLIYAVGELEHIIAGLKASHKDYEIDKQFKHMVIIPGFIEAHCHITLMGIFSQLLYVGAQERMQSDGSINKGYHSKQAVIAALKDAMQKNNGQTLCAWGYDPAVLDGFPNLTRQDLDEVSSTQAVIVINMSGHIAYVNSFVLQALGFDAHTDIVGVTKDANGQPTGVLEEVAAMMPVIQKFISIDEKVLAKGLYDAAKLAQRAGCTTISELALGYIPHGWETMQSVTVQTDFPVRISAYLLNNFLEPMGGLEQLLQHMNSNTEHLRLAGIKFVADGSIQGYTANMKWPYYYDGHANGIANISQEDFLEQFQPLHQAGIQCAIHVNGDDALQTILDAMVEVLANYPQNDHRHRLEHCQLPTPENLTTMAEFGVLANIFTNHLYYWGDFHQHRSVGPDRVQFMDPAQSAKQHGVRFSLHSDCAITPLEPLHMIWVAAARQKMNSKEVLGKDECISVEDGLRAMTIDAAYLLNEEQTKGSLEIGKFADMAMLDSDPLSVKLDKLPKIKVWGTMCGGRWFEN